MRRQRESQWQLHFTEQILSQFEIGSSAEGGLEIYQKNYRSALNETIAEVFPVTLRFLGYSRWTKCICEFLCQYRSRSPNLYQFVEPLQKFFKSRSEQSKIMRIAYDLVLLESGQFKAFVAADIDAQQRIWLDATFLHDRDPDQLQFALAPSASFFQSSFPVYTIWNSHLSATENVSNLPLENAESVFSWRLDGTVFTVSLNPLETQFFQLVQAGENFSKICQEIGDVELVTQLLLETVTQDKIMLRKPY